MTGPSELTAADSDRAPARTYYVRPTVDAAPLIFWRLAQGRLAATAILNRGRRRDKSANNPRCRGGVATFELGNLRLVGSEHLRQIPLGQARSSALALEDGDDGSVFAIAE
jgi:hypothetical protein